MSASAAEPSRLEVTPVNGAPGSSSWALDDVIEMGIHGVATLQPEAANMAPEYLKRADRR